ncbi:hypothetical protein [Pseudomonas sp. Gutcm_11s]|uniref:hypothetical protein n=1 Tax=Pseudomonas sp. Gutcm_11s TaxID=3026088 RepID=UPI00235DECCB|nr:hypothetical protein [Pseudomonas sp. Gutcm_11s]MDD0844205.1 hypothetical protein [Pseudomonas sp. Gutcm_11s]
MRRLSLLLILALSALAQAQPSGLPGTSTPQPYGQPQVRSITPVPRNSPPLLVNPAQPQQRMPLSSPRPVPRDQPLPSLETQRRSQEKHPAESIDKP